MMGTTQRTRKSRDFLLPAQREWTMGSGMMTRTVTGTMARMHACGTGQDGCAPRSQDRVEHHQP